MALKVKAKEQLIKVGKYAETYRYVMMPELYTALTQDKVIKEAALSAQRNRPYCALYWILRMMPKLTPVRRLICRMLAPKSFNCLMMRLRSSFS